jgi:two-component system chemotaxis response regulator CheY
VGLVSNSVCLVVDDSRVIRQVAANLLKGFGFQVAEAENGRAAVEFCRKSVPEFILLDWNMPEMDGITCLRAIRTMELQPRPSVVMCTTENGLMKIREALEAGADEFIMKPYDREVLLDKLVQVGLAERI